MAAGLAGWRPPVSALVQDRSRLIHPALVGGSPDGQACPRMTNISGPLLMTETLAPVLADERLAASNQQHGRDPEPTRMMLRGFVGGEQVLWS